MVSIVHAQNALNNIAKPIGHIEFRVQQIVHKNHQAIRKNHFCAEKQFHKSIRQF